MWFLRWKLASQIMRLALWVMPRSQPRDTYVKVLNQVRIYNSERL